MMGATTDEAAYERLVTGLNAKLDVYEKILGQQKYIGGDVRTRRKLK